MGGEEQYIRFHVTVVATSVVLIGIALIAGANQYDLFGPQGNRSTLATLLFVWITCLGTLLVLSQPWRTLRSSRNTAGRERLPGQRSRNYMWPLVTGSLLVSGLGLIWSLVIALFTLEGRLIHGIFVTTALISLPVLLDFVLGILQYASLTDGL